MGWIFKENDKPVDPKVARLRATLLSVPFGLMGLFALVLLAHDGLLGGLNRQKATGLASAIIVSAGFIALIFAISAKKETLKAKTIKDPAWEEKPWLERKEWATGKIPSSTRKAVL